jgi:hypothetical protein
MIRVAAVLADDEMAHILDWDPVYPAHGAPAELSDHVVFHVPCLKVDGAPYTALFAPQGSHAFKDQTTRIESRVCSFELAIVLVDHL